MSEAGAVEHTALQPVPASELTIDLKGDGVGRRFLVTSSAFDFDAFRQRRLADLGPGHAMDSLAKCLEAEIVQPGGRASTRLDRIMAKVVGQPEHWRTARELLKELGDGDLVYAAGDDSGLPIGLLAAARRRKIKLAIFYSAPHRSRPRMLTQALGRLGVDLLAICGSVDKVDTVDGWNLVRPGVLADEQTDTGFFRPLRNDADPGRVLITSCGLEQRDYATLASAIDGLAVDVKVCAASPNFTDSTIVAMPSELPANVEMRRFEFSELRSLYQRAAVTVVPLLANEYSAGMTTMMEAIACGSPVIITANPGLAADFAERGLVVGVPPGDTAALQAAIRAVLDDPEAAETRAKRARAHVLAHHSSVRYVELLCGSLSAFHASDSDRAKTGR